MKAVILAGGYGTRISEESHLRPKPMIEIGEKPILWHIMKMYSHYGFNDFVICLGYKGNVIKEYFSNYYLYNSDVTFDYANHNEVLIHQRKAEPWKVTLVDTGLETLTGGRLKRIAEFVGEETFMMTYGDGLSSIDLGALLKFHRSHGKLATVTVTQPPGRFGAMQLNDQQRVEAFREKPKGDNSWINAGFFVLEPQVFQYIEGDRTVFEQEPLERLASEGHLMGFQFEDFWHPMDTLRDKNYLDQLWKSGNAPWKK
ncbi:glucose-1-phosphate cytidylyltransferase [Paenibacillus sophorae]|uniref:Glucose-1-phosphate cytidylyltransferase n=1 Tax=Paenibacillus sophorae TaxID=1333845 RepID=A0A1H8Q8E1_9BACL|nr:glucose-1-phosphate cytidylyltransferase [Paenibacillus sophorae]QWU15227.1 glucose-1-phosphate cytidylyltransferase [Paenibacillus sophorae]SEO50495.1 glucose-1-phosphate cytidylyltransferase [Paenibacillus sophorae]